ncbi:MAG: hypothetical protein JWQ38_461 [Flavipsychrobacter sp.]|nr:hypothetical protein [Flavipsychrobacter sp.]
MNSLKWSDGLIPNPQNAYGTSGSPGVAFFNNKIYCARRARGQNDDTLWLGSFDGKAWSDDHVVPDIGTDGAPALAADNANGFLHCVRRGYGTTFPTNDHLGLWCASMNKNGTWAKDFRILQDDPNVNVSGDPTCIVFNDTLYCFYERAAFIPNPGGVPRIQATGEIWYVSCKSGVWKGAFHVANVGTSGAPALAVYNNVLYMVHEAISDGGWVWCSTFDGANWTTDKQICDRYNSPYGTSGRPALAVFQGNLYCAREGRGLSGYIWLGYTADGKTWNTDNLLPNDANAYGTTGTPSLVATDTALYCIREGRSNTGWVWCAVGTP